ncbi:hypothetical protein HYH03_009417 [Edaphochlamys debaryana]|uniref:Uncharacterized protein n=1 Tax=Edaphochlamys debaryana TaxID=47281 RepID=A0A835XXT7_9CHLO|nr:hypothetical protein HYH03_009417 [Edaphochlamys debaryana]|eukprot:KAG2492166.1 hypothetical protein HYH03_009417 [Edaphochlamys debaryana]
MATPSEQLAGAGTNVRGSIELERGAMVGSGQYSLGGNGKSVATSASSVPFPSPLSVPTTLHASHGGPMSPDAASPALPPGTSAGELRAMANALEDSRLDDSPGPSDSPGPGGRLRASHKAAARDSHDYSQDGFEPESPGADDPRQTSSSQPSQQHPNRRSSRNVDAIYSPKSSPRSSVGASGFDKYVVNRPLGYGGQVLDPSARAQYVTPAAAPAAPPQRSHRGPSPQTLAAAASSPYAQPVGAGPGPNVGATNGGAQRGPGRPASPSLRNTPPSRGNPGSGGGGASPATPAGGSGGGSAGAPSTSGRRPGSSGGGHPSHAATAYVNGGGGGGRAAQLAAVGYKGPAAGNAAARARARREELFEETDPAVVLEQSLALVVTIEGLIRESVGLAPDTPLDAIPADVAPRIPLELLDALEDTLEVIAMCREELARLARGSRAGEDDGDGEGGGSPAHAHPGLHRTPSRGARISGSGSQSARSSTSTGLGAGAGGGAGGGLGARGSASLPRVNSASSAGGRSGAGSYRGVPPGPPSGSPAHSYRPPSGSGSHHGGSSHYTASPPPSHRGSTASGHVTTRSNRSSPPYGNNGSQYGSYGSTPWGGVSTFQEPYRPDPNRQRAWHKEPPPEQWVERKQQQQEQERRRREAQIAADVRFLQQVRQRTVEVRQESQQLLATAEESVRAARSARVASQAQHRFLQYQDAIAEDARRQGELAALGVPMDYGGDY